MNQEEPTLTLHEFIEQQEDLEKEALEAFPGKFDKCTYAKNYIRQPLYVCRTCLINPDEEEVTAICYSCSISCHPQCDLIELFSRRNFKCDCGNSKYKNICSLQSDKENVNLLNSSHPRSVKNFKGLFCTCKEVYNFEKEESDMLQCLICEDWYHERCIGAFPPEDTFEEMICPDCLRELSPLQNLAPINTSPVIGKNNITTTTCLSGRTDEFNGPLFLSKDWRNCLCKCEFCLQYLKSNNIQFLTEKDINYEPEIDDSIPPTEGTLLDKIDRRAAIDGINAMDSLKQKLLNFLSPFALQHRVVTKEDIEGFFSEMVTTSHKPK